MVEGPFNFSVENGWWMLDGLDGLDKLDKLDKLDRLDRLDNTKYTFNKTIRFSKLIHPNKTQ
jgi:hypothetical protein